jgi:hypothetical protein
VTTVQVKPRIHLAYMGTVHQPGAVLEVPAAVAGEWLAKSLVTMLPNRKGQA